MTFPGEFQQGVKIIQEFLGDTFAKSQPFAFRSANLSLNRIVMEIVVEGIEVRTEIQFAEGCRPPSCAAFESRRRSAAVHGFQRTANRFDPALDRSHVSQWQPLFPVLPEVRNDPRTVARPVAGPSASC